MNTRSYDWCSSSDAEPSFHQARLPAPPEQGHLLYAQLIAEARETAE